MKRTAGQTEYINQRARSLMVDWCELAVLEDAELVVVPDNVFSQFAVEKGWLSPKRTFEETFEAKILSTGWMTAARFLKR